MAPAIGKVEAALAPPRSGSRGGAWTKGDQQRQLVDGALCSVTSRAIPVRPDDNTPLSELRRNAVAAVAVFVVVGLGAFAFVALLDWFD